MSALDAITDMLAAHIHRHPTLFGSLYAVGVVVCWVTAFFS